MTERPVTRLKREGRGATARDHRRPFGEPGEVIGGYWFNAGGLDDAARPSAGNPCLRHGLFYESRPIDPERASAYKTTDETPI